MFPYSGENLFPAQIRPEQCRRSLGPGMAAGEAQTWRLLTFVDGLENILYNEGVRLSGTAGGFCNSVSGVCI
jgi:hypothetical protein